MAVVRLTGAKRAATGLDPDPGFDATYGHTLADLLQCRAPETEPDDFDSFWQGIHTEAMAVDPSPQVTGWRPLPRPDGTLTHEVADLSYTSLDGFRIGGWVARPTAGAEQIAVHGHGYGGRQAPALDAVPENVLAIFPVCRGLPARSTVPGIGGEPGQTPHVLWGIESPRTYAVIGSVADLIVATTIAQALAPAAGRATYIGGSFGGGTGAMLLACDARFDAARLGVPTFGNHPVRVTQHCLGSGQAVREHVATHPEAMRTLAYADAATAATRVHIPVYAAPALADPSVPPPGQFSVVMSLPGPVWLHALPAGHREWTDGSDGSVPPEPAIEAFLADPLRQ